MLSKLQIMLQKSAFALISHAASQFQVKQFLLELKIEAISPNLKLCFLITFPHCLDGYPQNLDSNLHRINFSLFKLNSYVDNDASLLKVSKTMASVK